MATVVETVDAVSTAQTVYMLAPGDRFYGSNARGASDWVALTLQAGVTYSFAAVGIGAAGGGVSDPFLKLYGDTGAVLDADDDGGPGLMAAMTYTASSTGTCYVEVKALVSGSEARYGLAVTAGGLPDLNAEMAAGMLYRTGKSWAGAGETAVHLTWGARATGPAQDANGDATAFEGLTVAQVAATRAALANFADVAGVTFDQVAPGGTTDAATILVGAYRSNDGAGAYAEYPGSRAAGSSDGDLWINNTSVSRTVVTVGSYDYWVFLHELGHAMGLSHPGDYNAAAGVDITYAGSAQYRQDSGQYTVMSYFDARATEAGAPATYADTLMLHDILALQRLYGVNHATRGGDDVYGFHATQGGAYDFTVNTNPLLCIWDGAGRDRLDLSGFSARQRIDLAGGALSDVGGFRGNLSIAVGARIEDAVGGSGADRMYGNDRGNLLIGGRGRDWLAGEGGADRLRGGPGADVFVFGAGDGRDRIQDFGRGDHVRLDADLWGGEVISGAQVLDRFASLQADDLVLDFGADVLVFQDVADRAGMAERIWVV